MNEVLPLALGLLVGIALRGVPRRARLPVGAAAALLVGLLATVVSGEFLVGWEFLLVDVPLAALAGAAGYLAVPLLRGWAWRRRERAAERPHGSAR